MRIACPACNAAYQVPDEQLREGRVVRCVRCGTDWVPISTVEKPEPEPVAAIAEVSEREPEPRVEPRPTFEPALAELVVAEPVVPLENESPVVTTARPKRGGALLAIAWVASVAAVLAAVVLLYVGRERVMAAWPPSARGYAAIGLARR